MDAFTALPTLPPEQRWRGQTAPVPVVVALIRRAHEDGERLLLIRRAAGPYAGQWALVGGKWEFGETLPEAIVREVAEETGLRTSFVAVRGVVSERVAPWSAGSGGRTSCCWCAIAGGRRRNSEQDGRCRLVQLHRHRRLRAAEDHQRLRRDP
jgi:ADP-ribose pyrophosphatase YjhB (NUDIX family)